MQHEPHLGRRNGTANPRLDGFKDLVGLLEPSARRRAHVQTELPGVYLREEILPCDPEQHDRADEQETELDKHEATMFERPLEGGAIFFAQRFEATVERVMDSPKNITALML